MGTRGPKIKLTTERQLEFLLAYCETCSFKKAAEAIGITRQAVYERLQADPDFKKAFDQVKPYILDNLETEAYRRAIEGVQKPVYQGGKLVGSIREYSDTLLIVLLKANAPEKYRERHEISGEGGGPVEVAIKTIEAHITQ